MREIFRKCILRGVAKGPASCFVRSFVIDNEWTPGYVAGDRRRFAYSMKKTISVLAWIFAAVLFAASVTACGGQTPEKKTEERTTENTEAPTTEAVTEAPTSEAEAASTEESKAQ